MARAKPKAAITPRIWGEEDAAHRLGMSVTTFRQKAPLLRTAGFPMRDDLLGGFDSAAIERWLDQRSGLGVPANQAGEPPRKKLRDVKW